MKTTPPMVGVPRLPEWDTLMSRIGWAALSRVKPLIAIGVPNSETTNATQAATITALIWSRPSADAASTRNASTTAHVRYREPFTSTTSRGRSSPRSSAIAAS